MVFPPRLVATPPVGVGVVGWVLHVGACVAVVLLDWLVGWLVGLLVGWLAGWLP